MSWPYAGFTTDAITRAWSRVCHSIVSGWKHSGKSIGITTDNCALTNRPPRPSRGLDWAINSTTYSDVTVTLLWISASPKQGGQEHLLNGVEASRDSVCT